MSTTFIASHVGDSPNQSPSPRPNGHVSRSSHPPTGDLAATPTTVSVTNVTPLPPPTPPLPSSSSSSSSLPLPPPHPPTMGVLNPAFVSDDDDNIAVAHDDNSDTDTSLNPISFSDSATSLSTASHPTSGYSTLQPSQHRQPPRDLLRAKTLRSKNNNSSSINGGGVVLSDNRLLVEGAGGVADVAGHRLLRSGTPNSVDAASSGSWGSKRNWLAAASSSSSLRQQNATTVNTNTNNNNNNNNNNNGGDDIFDDDQLTAAEMVVVERPILTEFDLDQGGFLKTRRPRRTPLTWAKKKARKCTCSCACVRGFLLNVLPFLRLLRGYSLKRDLPVDFVAGLTVGVMHIPQGMAYGQLAGLPPVYGLYVSFFPVIMYFFLGTSKHISIGTFAVVSLMVGSVVDKGLSSKGIVLTSWNETVNGTVNETVNGSTSAHAYYTADNSAEVLQTKLAFAMAVSFAVGCVQLLLGLLRLGFLTVYLSDPLISGFTTGAACHVFTSQVKHLFGLEMGRYSGPLKLVWSYRDLFQHLPESNSVTLIASLICIVLLVVVKEYVNSNPRVKASLKMPVPVELVVVVLGTVISYAVKLEETYDVKIVGDVPVGIPVPKVQQFTYLTEVVSDAIAIGVVAFAISVSMAKILAKKHDYDIDPNQELLAYGTMNITCSFFSSFCSAASLSRSLVQDNVGGKTQVAGLVSSALLLVVLLVLGTYFRTLPNCILAAIIVVALKGMFQQFGELKRLWSISLIDFMVWLVAFGATVLLDVDLGLMVGILFALLTVIIRNQRPYACLLGQVPGTDLYRDVGVDKAAVELPHIKIFRFDSALFFANSEHFKACIYKMAANPRLLKKLQKKTDKELLKVQVQASHAAEKNLPDIQTKDEERSRNTPAEPSSPEEEEEVDTPYPHHHHHRLHQQHQRQPTTETRKGTPRTLSSTVFNASDSMAVSSSSAAATAAQAAEAAAAATEAAGSSSGSRRSFAGGGLPVDLTAGVVFPTVTDVYFIVIDCATMSYVDSVGVKVLQQVITEMKKYSIQVFLAHCKDAIREMFERTGFYGTSDKECLFLTVHDAVLYAQRLVSIVQRENEDRESNSSNSSSSSNGGGGGGNSGSSSSSSSGRQRGDLCVARRQRNEEEEGPPICNSLAAAASTSTSPQQTSSETSPSYTCGSTHSGEDAVVISTASQGESTKL